MFPVVGFHFWGSHLVFQDGQHCQILKWCFIAPSPLPLPQPLPAPLPPPPPSDEEEDWFKPPPFLPFFPPEHLPFLKEIRKRSPEDFEVEGWSRANCACEMLKSWVLVVDSTVGVHWPANSRPFFKGSSLSQNLAIIGTTRLLSARAAERKWIRRSKPSSSFWRVTMRPMAAVR